MFNFGKSEKRGFGFGVTSGVITTLGVIIGLYASTGSKIAIIGGILSVAIADAFSDALGIHISEESSNKKTNHKNIWKATFATFFSKLVFSGIFLIPIAFLSLKTGIYTSIGISSLIIGIFSYRIAKKRKDNPLGKIGEHLIVALIVVVLTFVVGKLISNFL